MAKTTDQPVVDPARVLPHDPYGHGHSVAAWTAVTVVMVGSAVASVGFVIPNVPLAVVGLVVAVAGGPVGKILGAMGLGSPHRSVR